MYLVMLAFHSLLRWVVLLTGALAVARAVGGVRSRREWTSADRTAGLWFTISLDVQFLIGLVLYVALSPMTEVAFRDLGGAMAKSVLRFWAVEHVFGMLVALVLVHVGRVRLRRAADASRRHKLAAIFFGLALVAVVLTIPWPGMPAGRPLFRAF